MKLVDILIHVHSDVVTFILLPDELYYSWERVGNRMPSSAVMTDHNRVLHIPDVQIMHSGTYKCTVTRENGLSASGTVQVNMVICCNGFA